MQDQDFLFLDPDNMCIFQSFPIKGSAEQDLRAVLSLGRCGSQGRTQGVTVGQGGEAAQPSAPPRSRVALLRTAHSREKSRNRSTQPLLRPAPRDLMYLFLSDTGSATRKA